MDLIVLSKWEITLGRLHTFSNIILTVKLIQVRLKFAANIREDLQNTTCTLGKLKSVFFYKFVFPSFRHFSSVVGNTCISLSFYFIKYKS